VAYFRVVPTAGIVSGILRSQEVVAKAKEGAGTLAEKAGESTSDVRGYAGYPQPPRMLSWPFICRYGSLARSITASSDFTSTTKPSDNHSSPFPSIPTG
jgi:hypothetical protein